MRYNWQHPNWPNFEYDLSGIQDILYDYAKESSALLGGLDQIDNDMQMDAIIDLMVSEAINTSEIEGEKFNNEDVRSSIKRQLGIFTTVPIKNPKVMGIAKLMVLTRENFKNPLTREQLFEWQKLIIFDQLLKPSLDIGKWRTGDEPMQIVSGLLGHEKVYFEAPPSKTVPKEMERFIVWYNQHNSDTNKVPGPVKSAIVHLYFESIHPFSDGNGRVGRALAEQVLSKDLGRPVLFSLSTTIQKNKKEYYNALHHASRYEMDITPWIHYFVKTVHTAQIDSKKQISFVLKKSKFWDRYKSLLNKRQEKVIAKIFNAGFEGFEGGITAQKYTNITRCSKATATRDLTELLDYGCLLKQVGRGRSTRYDINF